jgi:hypothetical protein
MLGFSSCFLPRPEEFQGETFSGYVLCQETLGQGVAGLPASQEGWTLDTQLALAGLAST